MTSPNLQDLKLGSTEYFRAQKSIIKIKRLVRESYDAWYCKIFSDFSTVSAEGEYLEIGSGGSYLKELIPKLITSDIEEGIGDIKVDARTLPFANESLKGIAMTHSFHHIPQIELFLNEANRTLVDGGVISLIEVANTPLAKFIFTYFHPEPFNTKTSRWDFSQEDSMNDSNQALSWLLFVRDRELFQQKYPQLIIERVEFLPWLGYLLSGGVTRPSFIPKWIESIISSLDKIRWFDRMCSLHWHIRIRKCKS